MRKLVPLLPLLVLASAMGMACGGNQSGPVGSKPGAKSGKMLKVVATTTQVADFSRVIAGSRADVYDVVKANVDAHDFEPSPADIEAIRDADVVIKSGVGLESWLEATIRSADPRGAIVDSSTLERARARGLDPQHFLDDNNAYAFFSALGDLIHTGPTGTNVGDLQVILLA